MFTAQQIATSIAENIESHMAAKRIKRKQLIQSLNLGYQAFERRMNGEVPFSVIEIWTIAEVLRTTPDDLLPASHSDNLANAA